MEEDTWYQITLQEQNEERFNRKHIDAKIRDCILSDASMLAKIEWGTRLIQQWMDGTYYESKMKRIAQLRTMNINELVLDIFVGVAYSQRAELFTSVTGKMAARLGFADTKEAIITVGEIMTVLAAADAWDMDKASKQASWKITSKIPLHQRILDFIDDSEYLPPMVCRPLPLTHNFSSGYLTHNDSLICGEHSPHHDGDICLDVLNLMNTVALTLNVPFLTKVEEVPSEPLTTQDQLDVWQDFKVTSMNFYLLLIGQGNKFYLTHKTDKRGRIYAMGYHISTQGAPFKKASLDLARQEITEGVPNHLRRPA